MTRSYFWRALVVVFIALSAAVVGYYDAGADDHSEFVPGEVLVQLRQSSDLPAIATTFGLDPQPISQFGSRPIYRLRIVDGVSPPVRAAALRTDARVVFAEPNYLAEAPEGNQQESWAFGGDAIAYQSQWVPTMVRLPAAHLTTRAAGITVAVLDTGIDRTHPLLAGRLLPGYDFVDDDNDPSEVGVRGVDRGFGHGTHVAGLVALAAPDAKILPIRVLDRNGRGNIWVLGEALRYAVDPDRNVLTADGAHVINLSLGTRRETDLLERLIELVVCDDDDDDCLASPGRGAVVVAAAGNRGAAIEEYPGAEAVLGSLAVAATTVSDTLAPFSSFGPWVLLAAPGDAVLSTVPGGYGTWRGTSMATGLVSGIAALVRAQYPTLPPAGVVNRMVQTGQAIPGPVPIRIDAARAVGQDGAGSPQHRLMLPNGLR